MYHLDADGSVKGIKVELRKNINKCSEEIYIEEKNVNNIFLATPEYRESLEDEIIIERSVSEVIKTTFTVGSYVVTEWIASIVCKPGVNIAGGVGSIVYGTNSKLRLQRCGGWRGGIHDKGSGD